jgi:diaminopimelate epimerase
MLVEFWKVTGAGNDFILLENLENKIPQENRNRIARDLCNRRYSIGADGLLVIENSKKHHFIMRYYNSDGTEAEMCGNGARCTARFAHYRGLAPAQMQFETRAGIYKALVKPETVILDMPDIAAPRLDINVNIKEFSGEVHFVKVGVPHVVYFVDDIEKVDVEYLGRALRHAEHLWPGGANINFAQMLTKSSIRLRTYERGVEEETPACGTGAVATAIVAGLKIHGVSPMNIHTRGGITLKAYYELGEGSRAKNVRQEGEARIVFRGEIEYDLRS